MAVIQGTDANDSIKAGNEDLIYGYAGDDTIWGGTGLSTLYGGKGNDTYYIDNSNTVIAEIYGEGTDIVYSSVSYTLSNYIETLILTGTANLTGTGNYQNNTILGNDGNNILYGGGGKDIFFVWDPLDTTGESVVGVNGADTMYGGTNDDTYFVDNSDDVIIEYTDEGTDTIYYSILDGTYTLPDNVENLRFVTWGDRNGNGNSLDNFINGNCGNNILNSFAGNDTIYGGRGDDLMDGGIGDDKLYGGQGRDTIYGGNGNDYIMGESQDDNIYCGLGNDTISGFEKSYIGTYTQAETFYGFGNDVITDDGGTADFMSLYNYQTSQAAFNALDINNDGKLDALRIAIGDYGTITINNYFDNSSSILTNSYAGTGCIEKLGFVDKNVTFVYVQTNATAVDDTRDLAGKYMLGTGNNDILTGGYGNDTIKGGSGNDTIYGGDGHDMINGENGSNTLYGGNGNDTYYVHVTGDKVIENLNEGIDTVLSSINYILGDNVENLTLIETDNINGTGNSLDNVLIGNASNNVLTGMDGNDTYREGFDNYSGGGATTFGYDTINDSSGIDILDLKVFKSSQALITVYDTDYDGKLNDLNIDLGTYGNICIPNYFDDSSSTITLNQPGTGCIEEIQFSDVAYYFTGIQSIATFPAGAVTDTQVTIIGGDGDDTLVGNDLGNDIQGLSGNDLIYGNDGNDTLYGGNGNDSIYGGIGEDIIDGADGLNTMYGGADNDIYYVNSTVDKVIENLDEGSDTIISTVSYILGDNVENLTLGGADNINGTGNSLENIISGNAGNNVLSGMDGNDTYHEGIDSSNPGIAAVFGADTINDSSGADFLDLTLFNSSQAIITVYDTDYDGKLNDLNIDLGTYGNIRITNYFDDSSSSIASNHEGTGYIESIQFSDITFDFAGMQAIATFPDGAVTDTQVTITGTDNADTLVGNDLGNDIQGLNGNDIIYGNDGNDTMLGGTGNDNLYGVIGDDTYILNKGDGVDIIADTNGNELVQFGDGITASSLVVTKSSNDLVISYADLGDKITIAGWYASDSNKIETFSFADGTTLTGKDIEGMIKDPDINVTGTNGNNTLYGNDGKNLIKGLGGYDKIYAYAGDDTLDGGSGADTMYGGLGNDTYIVDHSKDSVIENASQGIDTVKSYITYTLPNNVENLTLKGSGALNATGNSLDNIISGNSANNTLKGMQGDDTYIGYAKSRFGADIINDLSGNDYLDCYAFSSSSAKFSSLDIDYDGKIDSLKMTFGTYGSIQIYNYFDDSSSNVHNTHQGTGCIETIHFSNGDFDFAYIQNLL